MLTAVDIDIEYQTAFDEYKIYILYNHIILMDLTDNLIYSNYI